MKKTVLSMLLILCPYCLIAAIVKGSIIDSKGESLGFASVLIKGTLNGVMADADGHYQLLIAPGQYVLVCRFTAYKTVEKKISVSEKGLTVNFELMPQQLKINDVMVRANAEDPAYAIMRKVIEKRKYHEHSIKTLETDIYLKGNLKVSGVNDFLGGIIGVSVEDSDPASLANMGLDSNGSGIIYLLEEESHYIYQAPNKEVTKIQSVHVSGDPKGLGFATMPSILNIYRNNIDLLNLNSRGFVSPANSNAFHYYEFKYLGSFQQYGRTIDKIQVSPKRKYEPLFTGVVFVAEKDWVFQSVDLYLTKTSQLTGIDTLHLTQTFQPYKGDVWVIQNQVLGVHLGILGLPISGRFLTVYQNQKVNEPIDESLFSNKIISVYDSTATEKDSAYWAAIRPVPIKQEESMNFEFRDSVVKVLKKEKDSLGSVLQTNLGVLTWLFGNPNVKLKNNEWSTRPLISALQFNSVEGISATVDLKWQYQFNDEANILTLNWLNRYGFHNHHYNSLICLGLKYKDKNWRQKYFSWTLTAGQYVYQYNRQNPIMPIMNEIYTLFAGRNYLKIFENRLVALNLSRGWGNGFFGALDLSYEQRKMLKNTTDYSFTEQHDDRITANVPYGKQMMNKQDAAIAHLTLSYQPGVHYVQFPKYKQPFFGNAPIFYLNYTQAFTIGQATAEFAKWRIGMRHKFGLRLAGLFTYHIAAGGFLNQQEVNLPDQYHINGNLTLLFGHYLNVFQLAPYYRFSNTPDLYGEAHLEWHLNGLLTNKIPLFRKFNWFLVCGSNLLYINQNDYYAEWFVGLENIGFGLFRIGRVGFIMGYVSGSTKTYTGFRIGFDGILKQLVNTQPRQYL